jgi:hypothetical protein
MNARPLVAEFVGTFALVFIERELLSSVVRLV